MSMEEWKEYKLEEISCLSTGFPFKGNKYSKDGIRVVRGDNVTIGQLRWDTEKDKRWNEYFEREAEFSLRTNDIVIGMDGSRVGLNRAQIKEPDLPLLLAQRVACVRSNDKSIQKFLYYHIFSKRFVDYVKSIHTGTSIPHISLKQIGSFTIQLPPLATQQKIASILSSLDDKIEVNRRINEQLEELAQALFKSWFVDFEPFKDGEFVESQLGMIPEGWKVLSFNDFIKPSTEKVFVGELPEYSVTNNGIIPRDEKFKKQLSKTTSKNKVLKKNNLVFGMSRDILNWGIMEDLIGGVSSAYNVYIIDERQICPTYLRLYMSAKIAYFNDLIGNAAREGQSLDKAALLNKMVYFPNDNIWHDFFERYSTIKDNILINDKEITHLTALRDTLLPKLMSGEIDVNEVEI